MKKKNVTGKQKLSSTSQESSKLTKSGENESFLERLIAEMKKIAVEDVQTPADLRLKHFAGMNVENLKRALRLANVPIPTKARKDVLVDLAVQCPAMVVPGFPQVNDVSASSLNTVSAPTTQTTIAPDGVAENAEMVVQTSDGLQPTSNSLSAPNMQTNIAPDGVAENAKMIVQTNDGTLPTLNSLPAPNTQTDIAPDGVAENAEMVVQTSDGSQPTLNSLSAPNTPTNIAPDCVAESPAAPNSQMNLEQGSSVSQTHQSIENHSPTDADFVSKTNDIAVPQEARIMLSAGDIFAYREELVFSLDNKDLIRRDCRILRISHDRLQPSIINVWFEYKLIIKRNDEKVVIDETETLQIKTRDGTGTSHIFFNVFISQI
jgi:hypothetical protein